MKTNLKVLVVDVGGTHVKILATGHKIRRKFASGPSLTPQEMVSGALKAAGGWKYDVVSIGYRHRLARDRGAPVFPLWQEGNPRPRLLPGVLCG